MNPASMSKRSTRIVRRAGILEFGHFIDHEVVGLGSPALIRRSAYAKPGQSRVREEKDFCAPKRGRLLPDIAFVILHMVPSKKGTKLILKILLLVVNLLLGNVSHHIRLDGFANRKGTISLLPTEATRQLTRLVYP